MPVFILSAALSATTWWLLGKYPSVDDNVLRTVAGTYASVAVTMLGFMLAMLAILVSVADRKLIRNMNKTGHFTLLLKRIYWAAGYYGATMLLSMTSLFLAGASLHIAGAVCSGLMVGATASLIHAMRKLWLVLTLLNPPSSSPLE